MQLRLTVRRTARRAAHVIASSEYTRRDILETYHVAPARMSVVPLAAAPGFRPVRDARELQRVRDVYGIAGDYILAVGSIQPRKNLTRLVEAYASLRRQRAHDKLPRLVVVGKQAWLYEETLRAVEACGVSTDVIFTGYAPEADLPALYSGALCFVYPSVYEGFGLPPLEAMRCGAAVVAGDRTSLPEVVGDAGLLVNPFDAEEIAAAIARLIDDKDLRATLSERGLARAAQFDWRETARLTLEVYNRATGGTMK